MTSLRFIDNGSESPDARNRDGVADHLHDAQVAMLFILLDTTT
jgi:hypothetical protein